MSFFVPVEMAYNRLREHDLFKKDVHEGIGFSWPMLRPSEDGPDLVFFLYPDPPVMPIPEQVGRPTHWMQVAGESLEIKVFAHCAALDFAPPGLPERVRRSVPDMSLLEFRQTQKAHMGMFDRLVPVAFQTGAALHPDQVQCARDYLAWIHRVHPGFIPYYEYLAPDFYQWLATF